MNVKVTVADENDRETEVGSFSQGVVIEGYKLIDVATSAVIIKNLHAHRRIFIQSIPTLSVIHD